MNRRELVLAALRRCVGAPILCALVVMVAACPPKPDDGVDTAGSTSADPGSSSGEATGTASPGTASGSAGTSGEEMATTGGGASTGNESTGGAGMASLCDSYCAKLVECGEEPGWCAETCGRTAAEYGYLGEACLGIFASYTTCIQGHTCEEIAGDTLLCEEWLEPIFDTDVCLTPGCVATCAKLLECGTPDEDPSHCALDCSMGIGGAAANFGVACADAYEAAQVCVGGVTCEEFNGEDPPCADAYAAADAVCGA